MVLSTRRVKNDLIQIFKIINGIDTVDKSLFSKLTVVVEEDIQVSYARNVAGCRLDIRKYAFSNRIADKQNSLTQDCINCTTINAFKRHIQKTPETGNKTMFVLLWIVSYVGVNLCSLMPSAATSLVQRRCNYTGCLSGHECSLNSAH